MLKFTLRRLGTGVLLLFAVCTIAYSLLYLGAGSIAYAILGENATKADVQRFNDAHGIGGGLLSSYTHWLGGALHGDFGMAWNFADPVMVLVRERLGVTLILVSSSLVIAAALSLIIGVLAAIRGGWIDRIVQVLGLFGFAIPNFLVAFALVVVFAVQHHVFNAVGWTPPTRDFHEFLKSAVLPISAISLTAIASLTQQIRGAVKDTLQNDYVRTLRTTGLTYRRVVFKHVLRNSAGPALSVLGVQFVGMLGGIVIIEQIFSVPGMGSLSVQATAAKDIPTVMGVVTMVAIIVIVVNLLIDLASAALNPKVRLS